MREIKFRGKTKQGYWFYGVPVESRTNCGNWYIELVKTINYETDFEYSTYVESEEIDENTLGQYTGLKDKNGKEIYEGDIFKIEDGYLVVKYERGYFALQCYGYYEYCLDGNAYETRWGELDTDPVWEWLLEEMEIVGNIYDNPEWLKGEI